MLVRNAAQKPWSRNNIGKADPEMYEELSSKKTPHIRVSLLPPAK